MNGPLVVMQDAGVVQLVLNRPHNRNTLDKTLANALLCGIRDFGQDRSCRVLVLRGAGSHFCGGDEVSGHATDVAASAVTAPLDRHSGDLLYADICEEILLCPKPVLAAVHGVAVGAGAEIACAADQRILDQGARIGTGVITVGNIGGAVLLPRLVGYGRAMEIYLSGRLVGADEALRIGLADHVAPAHLFEQTVTTVAARLAQLPTAAVAHYKQLCLQTATMPITAALHLQNDYHKRIAISVADAHEGQTAFIESRPPRFSGS